MIRTEWFWKGPLRSIPNPAARKPLTAMPGKAQQHAGCCSRQQFRIMPLKHGRQGRWGAIGHRVDVLNERIDVRRHDEQISHQPRIRIPICMSRSAWHEHRRSGVRFHHFFPYSHTQGAFEHIPGLIIIAVKVQGSNPSRRPRRTAGVFPFCNHKVGAYLTKHRPSQRGSNDWRIHDGPAVTLSRDCVLLARRLKLATDNLLRRFLRPLRQRTQEGIRRRWGLDLTGQRSFEGHHVSVEFASAVLVLLHHSTIQSCSSENAACA
jgi:hypothetical protein